jgi:hypothetical protein
MHNAWTLFPTNARQGPAVKQEAIDQRAAGMSRARMDHQTWRFVDHQEGVVFVDNL